MEWTQAQNVALLIDDYRNSADRWAFCGIFCRPSTIFFLLTVTVIGFGQGVVERLLFVCLQNDLEASTALCGLSVGVTVLFELPLFHFSEAIHRMLGHEWMMILSMVFLSVRIFLYTKLIASTVNYILLLEPLHGLTFGLMWTAVQYTRSLAPPGWEATMQSIMNAITTCFGAGAGGIIGGFVFQEYGARSMYKWTSFIMAGIVFLNTVIHVCKKLPAWITRV